MLDLFCGMDSFTLHIGKFLQKCGGWEGIAALVRHAEYNAMLNNLSNVHFFQHNLEEDVTRQPWAA